MPRSMPTAFAIYVSFYVWGSHREPCWFPAPELFLSAYDSSLHEGRKAVQLKTRKLESYHRDLSQTARTAPAPGVLDLGKIRGEGSAGEWRVATR